VFRIYIPEDFQEQYKKALHPQAFAPVPKKIRYLVPFPTPLGRAEPLFLAAIFYLRRIGILRFNGRYI
jgi:hypothetical protein